MATHSFQNKRARNISRARSKSLTQKGKRKDDPPPSNIDFLAARACIGDQAFLPIHDEQTGSHGTSRTRSNSLAHTPSKSSHTRSHSHTDSWGQSARKIVKTAGCMPSESTTSSDENGAVSLETALKKDTTRIIRLSDPARIRSPTRTTPVLSISPTPSSISDSKIGVAFSTPPSHFHDDDLDRDFIRLPSHPYAQGGMYTIRPSRFSKELPEPPIYPPPHIPLPVPNDIPIDVSSRHRLPPHAFVPQVVHPYAQGNLRDSYISESRVHPQIRTDSTVPPSAKMWAQWSPGVARRFC